MKSSARFKKEKHSKDVRNAFLQSDIQQGTLAITTNDLLPLTASQTSLITGSLLAITTGSQLTF